MENSESNKFQALKYDEVLSIYSEDISDYLELPRTLRVIEFIEAIAEKALPSDQEISSFSDGIECEALKFDGQGWRKGKIRVSLEFCPDEIKSPLDDIRQAIPNDVWQDNS